jgi:nicotinamide-nucleotide amidase|tara:strand:- start:16 stop:516 length:501 start_codon:yes stop_codon:yes gene_type:complete
MTDNATMTISDLAKAIITLGNEKNVMLVLAESCTGGMIAAALTNIAGSSAVLDRSLVTYSDQAKQDLLGVGDEILASYGAVSAETAIAMTTGALLKTPAARLAASVTGIAGPGGGSQDKPVGLVHFSCQWRGKPAVHEHHIFTGDRDSVRNKSLYNSLLMIYNELK